MSSLDRDILTASGLAAEAFELTASADVLGEKPALLAGRYRGNNAVIRAWPVVVDGEGAVMRWDALAYVSAHPAFALNELSAEERERLRAESLTPQGASGPVGQAAVIGHTDAVASPPAKVDYAPPVQPLEATAEPLPDDDEIRVEEADCGYPGCMKFVGPDGTQVTHVEGCPEFQGAG